jgi:hypothetical protein
MSATWAPSPRLTGAATGTPLTIWPPVAVVLPAVDPAAAAGFPLPVQMPVFGSQLDALLTPVPVVPALLAPIAPGAVLVPVA